MYEGKPASGLFLTQVMEIVLASYEESYMRLMGSMVDFTVDYAQFGIWTFRHNDFFDTIEVNGEYFRWSAAGNPISAPVKTEKEWLEWLKGIEAQYQTLKRVA